LWIDQETEKRPGPIRAVEPVKKKKENKKIAVVDYLNY
jgi:hypothetical protein